MAAAETKRPNWASPEVERRRKREHGKAQSKVKLGPRAIAPRWSSGGALRRRSGGVWRSGVLPLGFFEVEKEGMGVNGGAVGTQAR
jgi:hypothetical protein